MFELKKIILKDGRKLIAFVEWDGNILNVKEWVDNHYEILKINKEDIKIIRDCNQSKNK